MDGFPKWQPVWRVFIFWELQTFANVQILTLSINSIIWLFAKRGEVPLFYFPKRKTTENWDENTKYKQIYDLVSKPTKLPFTLLLLQKFQIFEQRWIEETKPKLQVFKQKEEQVLLQRILRNRSSFFPSSFPQNEKSLSFGDKKYAVRKNLPLYTNLIGQCSGLSRNGSL